MSFREVRIVTLAILLIIPTLACGMARGSEVEQSQHARDYVQDLRQQISRSQSRYVAALNKDAVPSFEAISHVEGLRAELRQALLASADHATGSESVLAVNRAALKSLLKVINAYETVMGKPPDARTTAWNVLTDEQLDTLGAQALKHRVAVQKALDSLPPAEQPAFLLNRQKEISSWIGGLENEKVLRSGATWRGPPEIVGVISVDEARAKFLNIASAENGMRDAFERDLAYQIELRLTSSPDDASLVALRDRLPRVEPPIFKTAPKRPPPTIRAAVEDLEAAVQEENVATVTRDPIRRARAKARMKVDLEWLEKAGVKRPVDSEWGSDLLPTQTLHDLRRDYVDWLAKLHSESASGVFSHSDQEIPVVHRRLAQIDAELDFRAFGWTGNGQIPPDDPAMWLPAGPRPPPTPRGGAGTELKTYEASMSQRELSDQLFFLQREADNQGPIKNFGLQNEIDRTAISLRNFDSAGFENAENELVRLQANLLQDGRGPEAALEGSRVLQAQQLLQSAGDPKEVIKPFKRSSFLHSRSPVERGIGVLTESPKIDISLAKQPRVMEIPFRVKTGVPRTNYQISSFDDLFPKTDLSKDRWTRSLTGVMEDLHRAPGGVVVDARLPSSWTDQIQEARVGTSKGGIQLLIDGDWKTVEPYADAEMLRLAYAFVMDGRVMPIDLRNLNASESAWLATRITSGADPVKSDMESIAQALLSLTAVNVHPAMRDSALALKMIYVDQFIFDLLPDQLDPSPLYGTSIRFGMNVAQLRTLYLDDFHSLSDPNSWRSLFQKSILSVARVDARIHGNVISLDPNLSFAIYRLPAAKSAGPAILLRKSTAWLQRNEATLKRLPVLQPLVNFSTTSAVIRTIIENGITNNFDALLPVEVREFATPRLLCRAEGRGPCGIDVLRAKLGN